jgi:hypothetical protein
MDAIKRILVPTDFSAHAAVMTIVTGMTESGQRMVRGAPMPGDATNGRIGDSLRADSTWPALADLEDIEEFPLLLTSADVRALIDVAHRQGLSAAGLARRLITDYLRRNRGARGE